MSRKFVIAIIVSFLFSSIIFVILWNSSIIFTKDVSFNEDINSRVDKLWDWFFYTIAVFWIIWPALQSALLLVFSRILKLSYSNQIKVYSASFFILNITNLISYYLTFFIFRILRMDTSISANDPKDLSIYLGVVLVLYSTVLIYCFKKKILILLS